MQITQKNQVQQQNEQIVKQEPIYLDVVPDQNKYIINHNKEQQIDLGKNSILQVFPRIISEKESQELYDLLMDKCKWYQPQYMIGGNLQYPDRKMSGITERDRQKIYRAFKQEELQYFEDFPEIKKVKEIVENITKNKYSHVLLNYYESGKNTIGYHSDQLIPGQLVASVSLGAARKFRFQPQKISGIQKQYEVLLKPGSLVVFDENAGGKFFKHSIPKEMKIKEGRINLTFRNTVE
ncbi:hypothetical protein PPERSA_12027 [Pseudocohnilembus persalinus]|uniref:Fe2OG dioxygenase domain-containing protein n=1 Tax=Pseudocohnilembus persalinus TaxID=266149 RepID=A0A0V0R8T4_PSEPJ|nr:hypothetical protein PPERSA_12027 [Pseudocohnilembus persalinus]|eukprot:KRX10903.1 hypothetical protein PPERSA_12027 [Pseudocohnilembus persalinus]